MSQIRRILKTDFQLTAVVADADYVSTAAFRRGLEQLGLRYGVAIWKRQPCQKPESTNTRTRAPTKFQSP